MLKKIVLVEDDDVIRENYSELLTDEGFEVKAFSNKKDAMACFSQGLPDIAILDISLDEEREGGFQLLGGDFFWGCHRSPNKDDFIEMMKLGLFVSGNYQKLLKKIKGDTDIKVSIL